ncbi:DUF397 domain-containing protein [Streptomyces sp. NPDC002795]
MRRSRRTLRPPPPRTIAIRDSKDPARGHLQVGADAFGAFVAFAVTSA